MQEKLLELLHSHFKQISSLKKTVKNISSHQLSKVEIRTSIRTVCLFWFNEILEELTKINFDENVLNGLSSYFESLLEYSRKVIRVSSYKKIFDLLEKEYYSDLVHKLEIGKIESNFELNISPYIEGEIFNSKLDSIFPISNLWTKSNLISN